jgi:hypothetical protein
MTGNKRAGFIFQTRDRHLLSELGVMRIIDRETAKVVAGFRSTRRANARLLQLARAGLLRRYFVGSIAHGRKAVYTLSAKGSELVNSDLGGISRASSRLVVSDAFTAHQTGINQIYVALKYRISPALHVKLHSWHVFRQQISEAIKLTPDGYVELNAGGSIRPMFLEVDLGTEALSVWKQKASYYLQLAVSGEFQRKFREPQFRVLVVASSERRIKNIRSVVAASTDKIFWFSTFENIDRDGIWSPVWLRPTGDQRHSLL